MSDRALKAMAGICCAIAASGLTLLLVGHSMVSLLMENLGAGYSMGVIGGADGPTVIFLGGRPLWLLAGILIPALSALVMVVCLTVLYRRKKRRGG